RAKDRCSFPLFLKTMNMEQDITETGGRIVRLGQRSRSARGRRQDIEGRVVRWILFTCALVSVATTIGIVVSLLSQAFGFFREVSIWEFLTGTRWAPILVPQSFGVLPLVMGTLLVTVISAAVALPAGMATAIFLSEYAPDRVRRIIKPALELLAGIPTVVYGYFAITFVSPLLQKVFPDMLIFNALSAGLVMGLMIIPMVSSLSEDAMLAVPRSLRQGAYALGATRLEVAMRVTLPAALSGIIAAFILAISRAIGETMLVTIAAGATPKMTLNPLESIQTMTAFIVQLSLGETAHGSLEYNTIFAVGLLLFIMTLLMNLLGHWIVRRWQERY
ncbi:MAG: phosphate ABC transporter permease subunit PstC, partial [Dehalococcoidales bacterium]|nr:phosphate ABC transporter permease subunit PstC [Dehalococcoidales bacterium]